MTDENLIDTSAGIVAEGVAAGAVAGTRKGRRTFFRREKPAGECLNCGTALRGRICHSCGQDSDDFHRPIWHLVLEILDGLFSFDGRFWRTIPPLLIRPGHITRQYLSGVRARYVQPFRLLIAASVIFFLVFFLTNGGYSNIFGGDDNGEMPSAEVQDEALAELDAAAEQSPEAAAQIAIARAALEQAQREVDEVGESPTIQALSRAERNEEVKQQLREYLLPEDYPDVAAPAPDEPLQLGSNDGFRMTLNIYELRDWPLPARRFIIARAERIIDNPASWSEAMQRWTPRLVFLLLPLYALLLAVLNFWRRGLYLYDHLVVSLHFHAFLFIFLTILILIAPLISGVIGTLIFLVWSNIYLYRIHRVVYENGRFMAILRTLTLDIAYLVILTISLLLLMVVGLVSA
ncbi:DUF3667 domain-containing protein [Hyphobacterium marinum]|uniref:DUF3667 domain-containing protein n=1 Tax=Hyphobacterium marinum TaxID=3116574 RepID=A0ABU7M0M8_9PROT|nr:DUF3667 domain-containing protein [Hyphobacterium sp. Y6023]MEE2567379.1 DUF3667 domain-containing protein [Hyphobacterium sp. Y6023]